MSTSASSTGRMFACAAPVASAARAASGSATHRSGGHGREAGGSAWGEVDSASGARRRAPGAGAGSARNLAARGSGQCPIDRSVHRPPHVAADPRPKDRIGGRGRSGFSVLWCPAQRRTSCA
jgi:hypothetical protein